MKIILNLRIKILITLIITIVVISYIIWQHYNGGVASHHLLHKKELPKISNWWSILTLPLLTWVVLSIIEKKHLDANNEKTALFKSEIYGFIGAFLFGVVMTVLFYIAPQSLPALISVTFVLAFFVPLYKLEIYLGLALSMFFGFGGVLPVMFGIILIAIYALEYLILRKGILLIFKKLRSW